MSFSGNKNGSETQARVKASQVRERDLYQKKLSAYEREYRSNTSAISLRQKRLRESLLAYTERLHWSNRRGEVGVPSQSTGDDDELVVRAKPIRKNNRNRERRKILTLQELLNRGPNSKLEPIGKDPEQIDFVLQQQQQLGHEKLGNLEGSNNDSVNLSVANASDLNEMLQTKVSKSPPKQHPRLQRHGEGRENGRENQRLSQRLPPLQGDLRMQQPETENPPGDVYVVISCNDNESREDVKSGKENNRLTPFNSSHKRRVSSRNARQKRMKLPSAKLDLIPEVDYPEELDQDGVGSVIQVNQFVCENSKAQLPYRERSLRSGLFMGQDITQYNGISLYPVKSGRRKRGNDSKIGVEVEHMVPTKKSYHGENVILNGRSNVILEPINSSSREHRNGPRIDQTKDSSTKRKSQKRQRRLIFLRDSPTREE